MSGQIKLRIEQLKDVLDPKTMAKGAYYEFVRRTPIRTGNARRNTGLFRDTIEANYPYAKRLDEGYSRQSPSGMTRPTLEWLKRYLRQNLGK